ncbi:hypothetical protein RM572_28480 [Streptomyces sp. DSM 42041]|uniref:Helix-turn-helix domain-containing protein n=1 Tax=Streptomyces hazeniae TaxID=3075538 RepID=A0ABU2P0B6_9ACTN|nr:hypothetical protein [Streptomyces sp. DSM 42041]MDT0382691.1 hypothetical protein [Streptomyces sp. DSM 42041]
MATAQLSAPVSGAIHVRTRLSGNFTILANRLARRPGSAVTVGVALYINSMPDGTPVTIEALQKHFTEGETVISRALRELEADGWLERRILRGPGGRFVTRTYVYTLPELAHHDDTQAPPTSSAPSAEPAPPCVDAATSLPSPRTPQPTAPPAHPRPPAPATPEAVALLNALGTHDPRLALSRREIARLAPGVDAWLDSGVRPARITRTLTGDLPESFRTRPAAVLAWRLAELQPAPSPEPPPPAPTVAPLRNCPDCDRAHRSPTPGPCPLCAHHRRHPSPHAADDDPPATAVAAGRPQRASAEASASRRC